MSISTPNNLPDFGTLVDQQRVVQEHRTHHVTPAMGRFARHQAQLAEAEAAATENREAYRRGVEEVIRREAQAVAETLGDHGVEPDMTLRSHEHQAPNRTLRWRDIRSHGVGQTMRGKARQMNHGEVGGWILTPPQDPIRPRITGGPLPYSPVDIHRVGFALGEDGEIYAFSIKEAVAPGVSVHAQRNMRGVDLVSGDQISEGPRGYEYRDQIAPNYGHPDSLNPGFVPHPGDDDTTIIHGLGIRQGLAALQARAEAAAPPPTGP